MNDNKCTDGLTVMSYCAEFDMDRQRRMVNIRKLVKAPKGRHER